MADERWAQIYSSPTTVATVNRPLAVPEIPFPTCPQHCRHHLVEAVIRCRRCGGEAYHVLAHEWPHQEGHYWHGTVTAGSQRPVLLREQPVCCGEPMRRVWR